MSRSRRITLALFVVGGLVIQSIWALSARAELAGRLPRTPDGTDYQAWYDDQMNLTWLIDGPWLDRIGASGDGQIDWSTLARGLTFLTVDGHTGWRLPVLDVNRDGVVADCPPANPSSDGCADNELQHFYLTALADAQPGMVSAHQRAAGLESAMQPDYYWTNTACPRGYECRLAFGMFGSRGVQVRSNIANTHHVIVVRTGDVGRPRLDRHPKP